MIAMSAKKMKGSTSNQRLPKHSDTPMKGVAPYINAQQSYYNTDDQHRDPQMRDKSTVQIPFLGEDDSNNCNDGNSAHINRADAVVGIDIDYEVLGENGGMLMVTASGTAVKLA